LSAAHYRTEVKIEINKGLLVTNNRTRAKAWTRASKELNWWAAAEASFQGWCRFAETIAKR
jgi:hypothetical protein